MEMKELIDSLFQK